VVGFFTPDWFINNRQVEKQPTQAGFNECK
jgi:hypothetical protein